jgi:hypothetical protein
MASAFIITPALGSVKINSDRLNRYANAQFSNTPGSSKPPWQPYSRGCQRETGNTPGHRRYCDIHLFRPIASLRRWPITKQDHNNLAMKVQRFTYRDHLGKERIGGRLIFRGFQSKRRLVCEGRKFLLAARIICLWEGLPIFKKRTHASHPSIFSN